MRERRTEIKAYRAINEQEVQELISLNGGDISSLLLNDGEVDFKLHKGTNWDTQIRGWPFVYSGEDNLILEITERITDTDQTTHLDANMNFIHLGSHFTAKAKVTNNVKARICAIGINLSEIPDTDTANNG